ncbi:MAG TPA: hypothetical protein VHZ24_02050 [Pirellulales bacterium]|jgi:hypothetical protein|nr:hypothetical protein [Pirellulales bacterium]
MDVLRAIVAAAMLMQAVQPSSSQSLGQENDVARGTILATGLATLAEINLSEGRHDAAVAEYEAAIAITAPEVWNQRSYISEGDLSTDDIAYGEHQMQQLLKDRPEMAQHGITDSPIYRWTVRRFAGEGIGIRTEWDCRPPSQNEKGHYAEHDIALGDAPPRIRLAKEPNDKDGKPYADVFSWLWAGLVFEFYNLENSSEFLRLHVAAILGTVTTEQYVEGMLRAEFQAVDKLKAFYVTEFLPWARDEKVLTEPATWYMNWWGTLDHWRDYFSDKERYPWTYGKYYDAVLEWRERKADVESPNPQAKRC